MKDDRLISLNAAIDALNKKWRTCIIGESLIRDAGDTLKTLPPAQPVVISKSENATECEDAVSREAVLNEIHRYMEERDYTIGLLDDNVCGLPPVTPKQPGWIPCSERLPLFGQVLAQTNGGSIHEVFYKGKNDYDHDVWMRLDGVTYWDAEIVAWMPLPTPYREGGQDGKN